MNKFAPHSLTALLRAVSFENKENWKKKTEKIICEGNLGRPTTCRMGIQYHCKWIKKKKSANIWVTTKSRELNIGTKVN